MITFRRLNVLLFLFTLCLIAFSFYSEYAKQIEPCLLCLAQRLVIIILAVIFFITLLHRHNQFTKWFYNLITLFFECLGLAAAARQLFLQLSPNAHLSCLPGAAQLLKTLPLTQVLKLTVSGTSECSAVPWKILGLSPALWLIFCFIAMIIVTLFQFRSRVR
jgi:protein dithiol:quinone oxidoreductase